MTPTFPPPFDGPYEPSPQAWVRDQVSAYESSGGTEGATLFDTGMRVVIVTMVGARSGKVRKVPLMRVEHDGEYALVASVGGAPKHPQWYLTLRHLPDVMIQDGPEPRRYGLRELEGAEKDLWWQRAVAAYPPYAEYQANTDRVIPVLLASPTD